MKISRLSVCRLFIATVLLGIMSWSSAMAQILTFDDLTTSPETFIPDGYGGFQWNGFYVLNSVTAGVNPSGYVNGTVSGNYVAWSGGLADFSSNTPFNLVSVDLTAAWNNGLQVEVQGFAGSHLTYDSTYTVNTTGPSLINFNFNDVSRVVFIPTGGINAGYSGVGPHFVLDNLTTAISVPEPQGWIFTFLGLVFLISLRKLRSR